MGQVGLLNSFWIKCTVNISKYMRESFNDGKDDRGRYDNMICEMEFITNHLAAVRMHLQTRPSQMKAEM